MFGVEHELTGPEAPFGWPAASREAYVAELMMEALSTVDDRDAALVHFVRSVSPDEAAVLRDALGTEE